MFDLTSLAVKMVCPTNKVITDDAGQPSITVYIPKFKNSEVIEGASDSTHPAFIIDGQEIAGFYFSKYQNIEYQGKAYSLPAEDPKVYTTFDQALTYSENKGPGWHLTTAAEWAAVALWTKKNGTQPKGNNSYGKDTTENNYKAIPTYTDSEGRTCRVATGTGPLTWSHDGTLEGIWDLNGNVSEWVSGLRLVEGEIQLLSNNDAANPENPQNETSTLWKAINASTGELVDPGAVGTVKLDFVGSVWTYSTSQTSKEDSSRTCLFKDIVADETISAAAQEKLRALAMLPVSGDTDYGEDRFYANNAAAERLSSRGGYWDCTSTAGLFFVYFSFPRSNSYSYIGFRSAYCD